MRAPNENVPKRAFYSLSPRAESALTWQPTGSTLCTQWGHRPIHVTRKVYRPTGCRAAQVHGTQEEKDFLLP